MKIVETVAPMKGVKNDRLTTQWRNKKYAKQEQRTFMKHEDNNGCRAWLRYKLAKINYRHIRDQIQNQVRRGIEPDSTASSET